LASSTRAAGLACGLATPIGNLKVVKGVYGFAAGRNYHPLEATLLCAPGLGDWLLDLATTFGVEAEWVRGSGRIEVVGRQWCPTVTDKEGRVAKTVNRTICDPPVYRKVYI